MEEGTELCSDLGSLSAALATRPGLSADATAAQDMRNSVCGTHPLLPGLSHRGEGSRVQTHSAAGAWHGAADHLSNHMQPATSLDIVSAGRLGDGIATDSLARVETLPSRSPATQASIPRRSSPALVPSTATLDDSADLYMWAHVAWANPGPGSSCTLGLACSQTDLQALSELRRATAFNLICQIQNGKDQPVPGCTLASWLGLVARHAWAALPGSVEEKLERICDGIIIMSRGEQGEALLRLDQQALHQAAVQTVLDQAWALEQAARQQSQGDDGNPSTLLPAGLLESAASSLGAVGLLDPSCPATQPAVLPPDLDSPQALPAAPFLGLSISSTLVNAPEFGSAHTSVGLPEPDASLIPAHLLESAGSEGLPSPGNTTLAGLCRSQHATAASHTAPCLNTHKLDTQQHASCQNYRLSRSASSHVALDPATNSEPHHSANLVLDPLMDHSVVVKGCQWPRNITPEPSRSLGTSMNGQTPTYATYSAMDEPFPTTPVALVADTRSGWWQQDQPCSTPLGNVERSWTAPEASTVFGEDHAYRTPGSSLLGAQLVRAYDPWRLASPSWLGVNEHMPEPRLAMSDACYPGPGEHVPHGKVQPEPRQQPQQQLRQHQHQQSCQHVQQQQNQHQQQSLVTNDAGRAEPRPLSALDAARQFAFGTVHSAKPTQDYTNHSTCIDSASVQHCGSLAGAIRSDLHHRHVGVYAAGHSSAYQDVRVSSVVQRSSAEETGFVADQISSNAFTSIATGPAAAHWAVTAPANGHSGFSTWQTALALACLSMWWPADPRMTALSLAIVSMQPELVQASSNEKRDTSAHQQCLAPMQFVSWELERLHQGVALLHQDIQQRYQYLQLQQQWQWQQRHQHQDRQLQQRNQPHHFNEHTHQSAHQQHQQQPPQRHETNSRQQRQQQPEQPSHCAELCSRTIPLIPLHELVKVQPMLTILSSAPQSVIELIAAKAMFIVREEAHGSVVQLRHEALVHRVLVVAGVITEASVRRDCATAADDTSSGCVPEASSSYTHGYEKDVSVCSNRPGRVGGTQQEANSCWHGAGSSRGRPDSANWPPAVCEWGLPVNVLHPRAQELVRPVLAVLRGERGPMARARLLAAALRHLAAIAGLPEGTVGADMASLHPAEPVTGNNTNGTGSGDTINTHEGLKDGTSGVAAGGSGDGGGGQGDHGADGSEDGDSEPAPLYRILQLAQMVFKQGVTSAAGVSESVLRCAALLHLAAAGQGGSKGVNGSGGLSFKALGAALSRDQHAAWVAWQEQHPGSIPDQVYALVGNTPGFITVRPPANGNHRHQPSAEQQQLSAVLLDLEGLESAAASARQRLFAAIPSHTGDLLAPVHSPVPPITMIYPSSASGPKAMPSPLPLPLPPPPPPPHPTACIPAPGATSSVCQARSPPVQTPCRVHTMPYAIPMQATGGAPGARNAMRPVVLSPVSHSPLQPVRLFRNPPTPGGTSSGAGSHGHNHHNHQASSSSTNTTNGRGTLLTNIPPPPPPAGPPPSMLLLSPAHANPAGTAQHQPAAPARLSIPDASIRSPHPNAYANTIHTAAATKWAQSPGSAIAPSPAGATQPPSGATGMEQSTAGGSGAVGTGGTSRTAGLAGIAGSTHGSTIMVNAAQRSAGSAAGGADMVGRVHMAVGGPRDPEVPAVTPPEVPADPTRRAWASAAATRAVVDCPAAAPPPRPTAADTQGPVSKRGVRMEQLRRWASIAFPGSCVAHRAQLAMVEALAEVAEADSPYNAHCRTATDLGQVVAERQPAVWAALTPLSGTRKYRLRPLIDSSPVFMRIKKPPSDCWIKLNVKELAAAAARAPIPGGGVNGPPVDSED